MCWWSNFYYCSMLPIFQFIAVIVIQIERVKGVPTSGVLFLFYTLLVIAGIVPFYMKILDPSGQVRRTMPQRIYTVKVELFKSLKFKYFSNMVSFIKINFH